MGLNGKRINRFCGKVGQSTVSQILSLTGLGGARVAHLKLLTLTPKFWRNKTTNFWGLGDFGALRQKG